MIISMIAAVSRNMVIGSNGIIPWKLGRDLKYFGLLTTHCPIIMGRKTHESLGRVLPNRKNIVLTKNPNASILDGSYKVCSIEEAIEEAKNYKNSVYPDKINEVFVIGGGEIYNLFLPYTDRIYLTEVYTECEGDAFFPNFDIKVFRPIIRSEPFFEGSIQYTFTLFSKNMETDVIKNSFWRYNSLGEIINIWREITK